MIFSLVDTTKLKDPNLGVNWGVQPLNLVSKVKLKLFEVSWTLSRAFGQLLRLLGSGAVFSGSSFFGSRQSEMVVGIGGSWLESGISEGCDGDGVWSVFVLVEFSAIWDVNVYETKKVLFLGWTLNLT